MAKQHYQTGGGNAEEKALSLFADMMIEKIQSFKGDWHQPWFAEGQGAWPRNLSGREYGGMNALMLMLHCEEEGLKYPIFGTFNSITSLNYVKDKQGVSQQALDKEGKELPRVSILTGSKSFPVFITTFTVVNKETKEKIPFDDYKNLGNDEKNGYDIYPKLHVYHVFHIDHTNLNEARPELYANLVKDYQVEQKQNNGVQLFKPLDKLIKEQSWVCPIHLKYGNNAYYSMAKDEIVLPEPRQFHDGLSFAGTAFHEMAHSTGSETRLNRLKPSSFGSDDYAREELVAELCAALLCQRYGMFKYLKDDSVPYLKDWLENLKKEPSFIKTVLVDVKKASSMVIDHVDKLVTQLREDKEGMTEDELNQEQGSEEQESSNYFEKLKESDDENEEVVVRTSRR